MQHDELFVYGTLHPARAPKRMRSTTSRMEALGAGAVRGMLYDLGAYPGLILQPTGPVVSGHIFRVRSEDWPRLDEYEGYGPARPDESLFVRKRVAVTQEHGRACECWVYVYNRALPPHARPASVLG